VGRGPQTRSAKPPGRGIAIFLHAAAKKLVTTGVYSKIRHPVYVFSALTLVGMALYFQRPILLLFLAVIVPMQVARARSESRTLEDKFGEEYRAWRIST